MGKRIAAKITGVAGYVPPRVVTNTDLEKIVDTNDEWIRTRTGIRERHYADPGVASSHLGTEAARKLWRRRADAGGNRNDRRGDGDAGHAFSGDGLPDSGPAGSEERVGIRSFGGVFGIRLCADGGRAICGRGTHKKVLVIGSDVMTSILDYKDRATCVLFGDGAGAVLLEPATSDKEGILDFAHDVDGSGGCILYMPGGRIAASGVAARPWRSGCTTCTRKARRSSSTRCGG